jgi:hypothetical protein
MFSDLVDYPIVTESVDYEVQHVLRDLDDTPTLLIRVELTGTEFPHRALEPYVRIGDLESWFVMISDDGTVARAYFDQPLAEGETIEFGYGPEPPRVQLEQGIRLKELDALDPQRLPEETRFVDRFFENGEPVIR